MKANSRKPTVYVVDDDEHTRNLLKRLILSIKIAVATYDSAESFLSEYDGKQPGCLLLDVRMPGMSGIRLLERLLDLKTLLPIILLTGHGDIPMAVRAMQNGAFDFIEKPFDNQHLLDRIQDALKLNQSRHDAAQKQIEITTRLKLLTLREQQVLEGMIKGLMNKQIAADLGISDRTVEMHRKNIMEKMQVDSFAELIRIVVEHRQ